LRAALAAAIINATIFLACIATLLLAYWVLRQSWEREPDGLVELLVQELVTESPALLPGPYRHSRRRKTHTNPAQDHENLCADPAQRQRCGPIAVAAVL
jgi:hypothetical protein